MTMPPSRDNARANSRGTPLKVKRVTGSRSRVRRLPSPVRRRSR
jgi:hypothetical protein